MNIAKKLLTIVVLICLGVFLLPKFGQPTRANSLTSGESAEQMVFEQRIKRFDEKGNELEPIVSQFTLEELAYRVLPQTVIDNRRKNKEIKRTFEDTKTPVLPGEQWVQHSEYKKAPKYYVSNLGRIKVDDKIIEQKEKYADKTGYLVLREYNSDKEVYKFVAEVWLEKDENSHGVWNVHHITNDGYDNRPENLLWVRREYHSGDKNTIHGLK